jgi:DNA-binding CsgD family transcriptional regulator
MPTNVSLNEHAEQPPQERPASDVPSVECQSVDGARTRSVHSDGEISLPRCRPLLSERWTLVDTYERDGKRYVVAWRNDAHRRRPDALSPRERQVLELALGGDSNKRIAYELGISASTVGVLLHRASEKLGTHGRAELLQRFRDLPAATQSSAKPFGP